MYRNSAPNEDLVYGLHAVQSVIESGKTINKIMVQKDAKNPELQNVLHEARKRDIIVQYVPKEKLNKFTNGNHQGIVCLTAPVEYDTVDQVLPMIFESGNDPMLIVLDGVTDVRNLGAIARTAYCAGADALVIPGQGNASVTSDAVKTSAGALLELPVCREKNLRKSLEYIKDSGIRIVAVTEHAKENLFEADLKGPLCLILGSEEEGISPTYRNLSTTEVRIPMVENKVGSYNVGIAAAMVLTEWIRQNTAQA